MKILECDLYNPIKSYFEDLGYEVKSEIIDCDVTAVKGDQLVVVEMKTTLNLDVIMQAAIRQRITDIVYIAVPKKPKSIKTKRYKDILYLIRRLELGLLLVTVNQKTSMVEEVVIPKSFSRDQSLRLSSKKRKSVLKEFNERLGDFNKGGVTRQKITTAYKQKAIHIAVLLKQHGSLSIKELKSFGTDPKKTNSILQQNHYAWFNRKSRGVYGLTNKGIEELQSYEPIVQYLKETYQIN